MHLNLKIILIEKQKNQLGKRNSKAYWEPLQTSKMEIFAKIVTTFSRLLFLQNEPS